MTNASPAERHMQALRYLLKRAVVLENREMAALRWAIARLEEMRLETLRTTDAGSP